MDPTEFFTSSRVHIIAGKGGVGKTTVTAALARVASAAGLSVLVVEIEGKATLPALFGQPSLGYEELELVPAASGAGGVRARALTADRALIEYLDDHGLGRIARRMIDTGVVEVVTRGAPGMKDILLLGKIKQLERAGAADVILVDAPASGHAITFLRSPRGLLDAVRLGPINSQARDVLDLLTDPARCQVLLVSVPEETPVNELVETAFSLEEEVGIQLGPVIVNGVLPPADLPADPAVAAEHAGARPSAAELAELGGAAAFRRERDALQAAQLDRLAQLLPLPQLRLGQRFRAGLDAADLDTLAEELETSLRSQPTVGLSAR